MAPQNNDPKETLLTEIQRGVKLRKTPKDEGGQNNVVQEFNTSMLSRFNNNKNNNNTNETIDLEDTDEEWNEKAIQTPVATGTAQLVVGPATITPPLVGKKPPKSVRVIPSSTAEKRPNDILREQLENLRSQVAGEVDENKSKETPKPKIGKVNIPKAVAGLFSKAETAAEENKPQLMLVQEEAEATPLVFKQVEIKPTNTGRTQAKEARAEEAAKAPAERLEALPKASATSKARKKAEAQYIEEIKEEVEDTPIDMRKRAAKENIEDIAAINFEKEIMSQRAEAKNPRQLTHEIKHDSLDANQGPITTTIQEAARAKAAALVKEDEELPTNDMGRLKAKEAASKAPSKQSESPLISLQDKEPLLRNQSENNNTTPPAPPAGATPTPAVDQNSNSLFSTLFGYINRFVEGILYYLNSIKEYIMPSQTQPSQTQPSQKAGPSASAETPVKGLEHTKAPTSRLGPYTSHQEKLRASGQQDDGPGGGAVRRSSRT